MNADSHNGDAADGGKLSVMPRATPPSVPCPPPPLPDLERRLTGIVSSIDAIVWEFDPVSGHFTFVSEKAVELLGYPLGAWLEEPDFWPSHLHPEDREMAVKFCADATQRLENHEFEYRMLAADGRAVWLKDFVRVDSLNGRAVRLRGVMVDITSRKRIEAELRKNHALLERIFDSTEICIAYLDRDFNFLRVNRAYAVTGRQTPEFFVGKNHFALYPGDEAEAIFREVVRTGQPYTTHARPFVYVDQPERGVTYWNWTITPVKDASGHVDSLFFVLLDVTHEVRVEEAIRASEARYRLLFDRNPLPLWVCDLDTCRILAVNETAVRHYGYSAGEFRSLTIAQLSAQPDLDPHATALRDSLQRPNRTVECHHRRRDESIIVVELQGCPIDYDGRTALLVIAHDVTARKNLEEQLLRSQRLENLGMLAAGIAHDFNNILSPILMAGQLLRAEPGASSADQRLLDTLVQSAERGAGLVRQILAFAHGTGGERHAVQLKHVARDILSLIEETFPPSIRLDHSIPADLWPTKANATQIHQVLLNLCVNARDAMPNGGTLRLHARNVVLDAAALPAAPDARAGRFLCLEVGDTGTGIPPDVFARIWEPFFTTKPQGKGTGLGLSTVRAIVANHEGFATVDTAVGQGTTFRIYLPVVETDLDTSSADAATRAIPRGDGELILVVDDEASVRDLLGVTLTTHGYTVALAAHGIEAALVADTHRRSLRLVITDLVMPQLGGEAFVQLLRRQHPHVPILAVTGSPGWAKVGVPILYKPFKPETLLAAVHSLLHPDAKPSAG
ncbi:MAG: PAS domain S-box protein [Opitutae bacterium]|nr:PAS domain S-box protein [Opitutae bacterium]